MGASQYLPLPTPSLSVKSFSVNIFTLSSFSLFSFPFFPFLLFSFIFFSGREVQHQGETERENKNKIHRLDPFPPHEFLQTVGKVLQ